MNFSYVASVTPTHDYKLRLTFENGEKKIFDVRPILSQRPWASLRDLDFFMKAKFLDVQWLGTWRRILRLRFCMNKVFRKLRSNRKACPACL